MCANTYTDCFEVVNGPEDGTQFPVTRTPVFVGRNPQSLIHLRLDNQVRDLHAQITAVSDGYRVRRWGDAPVYVNGKRAGMIRSRIMRNGDVLQVGRTLICLDCVPDGLASRSRGMVSQSDLVWAAKEGAKGAFAQARALLRGLRRLVVHRTVVAGVIVVVVLAILFPGFRFRLLDWGHRILWTLRSYLPGQ